VPKEIRYRPTPKRRAACRQKLLKAAARRPPARPSPGPWPSCSLGRTVRYYGDKLLEAYRGHVARVVYVLDPESLSDSCEIPWAADPFP